MADVAYAIWCVEPDGSRQLVRDDITDKQHVDRLVSMGNEGAKRRNLGHHYESELLGAQAQPSEAGDT